MEAVASARAVVADAAAGAVAAGSVAIALEGVRAGRALHQGAVRATAAKIADASDVLLSIPRRAVCAGRLGGQLLLSEANTGLIAVVRARRALAGDTVVVGEALAFASLAVTDTLTRALNHGVR